MTAFRCKAEGNHPQAEAKCCAQTLGTVLLLHLLEILKKITEEGDLATEATIRAAW